MTAVGRQPSAAGCVDATNLFLHRFDVSVDLNLRKNLLDSPIATDDHSCALDTHVLHTVE